MKPRTRKHVAAQLAFVGLGLQSTVAHASGVELFLQAPYDFVAGRFDLEQLEYQNLEPILAKNFAIPYAEIEATANSILQPLAARGRQGHVACEAAGIDGLCPDADWSVNAEAGFTFTQRNQPVLTQFGDATNNGVHVVLDSQVQVGINGHIRVTLPDSRIPDPDNVDIPVSALISIHGEADVTLYPVVSLQNLEVEFTNQSLDLQIHGLEGQAIGLGAGVGIGFGLITGVSLGPIADGLLGGLVGQKALEVAKDEAKKAIEELVQEQLAEAGKLVTKEVNGALQPRIGDLNNLLGSIKSIRVPALNQTLEQLQSSFGLSVDVRSLARDDIFHSVVTARFAEVPGTVTVNGVIRFPTKACNTFLGGSSATGPVWGTDGLIEVNKDLVGMSCADLLGSEFGHAMYYGGNPERMLQSGDPQNNLPSWGSTGSLSTSGAVQSDENAYWCAFTVSNLPNYAIVEFGASEGTRLQARMKTVGDNMIGIVPGARPYPSRYVLAAASGTTMLLDHYGQTIWHNSVQLGNATPDETSCPSGHGMGVGEQPPVGGGHIFDIDHCPMCGVEIGGPEIHIDNAPVIKHLDVPVLMP